MRNRILAISFILNSLLISFPFHYSCPYQLPFHYEVAFGLVSVVVVAPAVSSAGLAVGAFLFSQFHLMFGSFGSKGDSGSTWHLQR